eukprot:evm.model.scf_2055.1 EVM.evm.TU.scf_2055.1   scf_2055:1252-2799(+)
MAAVLFKVFTLGIRTLARPVGNGFQAWALQHPAFRQQCIKVAQLIHKTEVWITRGAEGKEGKAFVGAITEEKGMELASKLVSEGFVFTVGAAVLAWEYTRAKRKDLEAKALERKAQDDLVDQVRAETEFWAELCCQTSVGQYSALSISCAPCMEL